MKFGQNPISGLKKLFRDAQTDTGQTKCDHKSSLCDYLTGELKKKTCLTSEDFFDDKK